MKKRSWKEDRRVINKELFPAWRAMRATEIRRRDIRTLIEKIAERPAPSMANRTQALIHKMFNFAIAHEIVGSTRARSSSIRPRSAPAIAS